MNAKLSVQLRISKENAYEYFKKYQNKKLDDIQSIILNTTQQQLEKVTIQYNIMELLGDKRNEAVEKTLLGLQEELKKDGIIVERLTLIDTDAGDLIEGAIEKEASAKKEAEAQKYLKEKVELEGEAKVIEAQKEKEANDLKTTALTNAILMEKFIEKWNGQLPTTTLNDDILSMFTIK